MFRHASQGVTVYINIYICIYICIYIYMHIYMHYIYIYIYIYIQHCTDEAQKAETVLSAVRYSSLV